MTEHPNSAQLRPLCACCGARVGLIWVRECLSNGREADYCQPCAEELYKHVRIEKDHTGPAAR